MSPLVRGKHSPQSKQHLRKENYLKKFQINEFVATVLKKIRLYCIISKYDSFIHVWGKKNKRLDALKTHIQNICTHTLKGIWEFCQKKIKNEGGKIKYKQRVECRVRKKILSQREQKCNKTLKCQESIKLILTWEYIYIKNIKTHA